MKLWKVRPRLTLLFSRVTPDGPPFENIEEGDLMSSLKNDIGDYFHIEKEKWDIFGPQFDCAPIYDTDKEDEIEIGFSFIPDITCNNIPIDAFGKENYYFPLHEEGQLEVIDSSFSESPIFDAYNEERNEAPTYPPYDYVFKSLEPLECGEGNPVEYDTLPLPFSLVHHLEFSSSHSLISFDMTSSDHAPFPFLNMVSRKNPSLNILYPL